MTRQVLQLYCFDVFASSHVSGYTQAPSAMTCCPHITLSMKGFLLFLRFQLLAISLNVSAVLCASFIVWISVMTALVQLLFTAEVYNLSLQPHFCSPGFRTSVVLLVSCSLNTYSVGFLDVLFTNI